MCKRIYYKLNNILIFLILSGSCQTAFSLQDYSFSVDEPKLIIFPETVESIPINTKSRLSVLTEQILNGTSQEIQNYIKIVLTEMVAVYKEEADRARQTAIETEDKNKKRKLFRWSNNTLSFSEQLTNLYNGINEYTRLQIYTDINSESYLLIDDYPVVVSSPVINEQKTLQERIIKSVCAHYFCDMEHLGKVSEISRRKIKVTAGWKIFKDKYVFYTQSGLHFVFKDISDKKIKQKMSIKIAGDLNLIADVLAAANKKGIFIDWEYLYMQPIPGDRLHELVINPFGDKIVLQIKAIQFLNDFPEVTIPWLKERMIKASKQFYFHKADDFLREIYK